MRLLPKSIHWCRRYPTKFNSGRDIPQITAAMNNLEAVLKAAGMGYENLTRVTVYTTDVDEMIENWDAFAGPSQAHS